MSESSGDSENLKDAIRQSKMIESGLTGMSPDQRYMAKKRDEAIKLMEQKEKLIKKGL